MSSQVESQIVQLGFDNKEFETNTRQTIKSMDAMKKSLNFDESARSIQNLSKGFNLSSMGDAVQGLSSRFSTMGIVGMTVIQNLTNAAIQYGKKLFSQFVDPMKAGFSEYETQMNAIQTVLANTESKGTTLTDVTAALDELNTYADKTIYNFTEMTKNIGTFTAAGVDLDTSVSAIKGIANLAAVSGSSSVQAATGMYQLSQALSSGTVRLQDWNSVQNAGMGGEVFRNSLLETARVHGVAIDDIIESEGSFRESLSTGWLSSDILLETLSKFTGDLNAEQLKAMGYTEDQITGILKLGETANDAATKVKTFTQLQDTLKESLQSGWTKSWEIIIGDFEQAKELFSGISDTLGGMIEASSNARNTLLENWAKLGGRENLINSLYNGFNSLMGIMEPIKAAFREIFPDRSLQNLIGFTRALEAISGALSLAITTNADKLQRIFAGVFAVFKIGVDIVTNLGKALFSLFSDVASGIDGAGLLEKLAQIGDAIVAFQQGLNIEETFTDVLGYLGLTVTQIRDDLKAIIDDVSVEFQKVKDILSSMFSGIDLQPIKDFFGGANIEFKPFQALLQLTGKIITFVLKAAQKMLPGLAGAGKAIFEFVKGLGGMIADAMANIDFVELFSTINTALIGAILLAIRNLIEGGSGVLGSVEEVFGGIGGILDGVRGSLEAWQANLKAKTLMTIAIAIGILALSLVALSLVDSNKLTVALGIMTGMFVQLIAAQAAYSKIGGGLASGGGLILMAASLLILAGAIAILAQLDKKAMEDGLGIIYALLAGMLIFIKLLSGNSSGLITASLGMIGVALSLLFLSTVVKKLGELNPETLQKGLVGVGVLLAEIAIFMKLVDEKGPGKALGLLAVAGAISILGFVVEKLGNLDVAVLQKGLLAIGAVLLSLAIFSRISGNGANLIATAIGMTILGAALTIFVDVIKELGSMSISELATGLGGMAVALLIIAASMRALPKNMILQAVSLLLVAAALKTIAEAVTNMGGMTWEEIAKGLVTLAGALLIIAAGLYLMSGTLAGSAALLVASVALSVLSGVLQTLGSMALSEIGLALLALAGIFVVLGLAGLVLTPLVPTLLGLGAAMFLIGVGAALVGAGLLLFSTGLLALAAGGTAAALGIVAFVTTLLGLLPVIVNVLIETLIVFAKGIQRAAPEVAKAITAIMVGFLQVIIDTAPKLFEALDILLTGLIDLIVEHVPEFIAAVILLLVTLLEEIAKKMPDFLAAGFTILIEFLKGIRDNIGEVVTVVIEIVTEFIGAVAEQLPDIIQSGWDLMIAFIDGMADGIDNNMQPALDAVGRLASAIIDGLLAGLQNGAQKLIDWIVSLARRMIAAIFGEFESESPSKVMIRLGGYIIQGLILSLQKGTNKTVSAATKFGKDTKDALTRSLELAMDVLSNPDELNPKIHPVVDMTDLETANALVQSLFGDTPLTLTPALANIGSITTGLSRNTQTAEMPTRAEGTQVLFNQTLNSPKALSRTEIYRQTKNLLFQVKGVDL